ncbi:hypothetical protein PVA45_07210 (plasmid) [Entomospira entomophila]|uniref:Uncharacterized protein n=1 Tax=Entomospira entomophila TaxID=2719988 RepID=A0A968KS22_9SPIO|nr:hypothetical protein [Entomospira entomophilus]NIZ41353.1 hypothetical protein [Entomospira entomophilus]WDI36236.1 hypothetical protein PVA45_07210 [Entomospira entomophilus]
MLNQATLTNAILDIVSSMNDKSTTNSPMADAEFANQLASAIHDYVSNATVMVDTFVASNGAGPVSGTATGKLL